jgi:hypothetical protein
MTRTSISSLRPPAIPNGELRAAALAALSALKNDDRVFALMTNALRDPYPGVRVSALAGLSGSGRVIAAPAIADMATGPWAFHHESFPVGCRRRQAATHHSGQSRVDHAGFRGADDVGGSDRLLGVAEITLHFGRRRGGEQLLVERGVDVDYVTVCRWVQRFSPLSSHGPSVDTNGYVTAGANDEPSKQASNVTGPHR